MLNKQVFMFIYIMVNAIENVHLFLNFLDFYMLLRYVWLQSDILRMHYA